MKMTASTSRGFRQFLSRAFLPLILLVLALSLGGNVFLHRSLTTFRETVSQVGNTGGESGGIDRSTLVRSPQAFGVVNRIIPVKPQSQPVLSGSSLLPVREYQLPGALDVVLPASTPLYRDEGVRSSDLVEMFFSRFSDEASLRDVKLDLTEVNFLTPDGQYTVSVRTADRSILVKRVKLAPPRGADHPPLSDQEAVILATELASIIGQDTNRLGPPTLVAQQGGRVSVRWAMRFSGSLVLNPDGTSVSQLSIAVDRASGEAVSLTFRLLSPEILAAAEYPVLGREQLSSMLKDGGLLPLSNVGLTGEPRDIAFTAAERVYILLPSEKDSPVYVVPGLRASWTAAQTCATCSPVILSTLIPVLDPQVFVWREMPVTTSSPASSESASGANVPASGTGTSK